MPQITVRLETPIRRSFRVAQVAGMFDVPLEERLAHELTAEVPGLNEPWTIGVIVGPSGSGKTTLARAAFGAIYEPPPWPRDRAIIDCLEGRVGVPPARDRSPKYSGVEPGRPEAYPTIKEATRVLCGVGLGSVPTWLKPYQVLSTGERFRADLARAIVGSEWSKVESRKSKVDGTSSASTEYLVRSTEFPALVIDEFTSSLDRTVAKTTSAALSRLLHNLNPEPRTLNALRLVALTCHDDIVPWLEPDWVLHLAGPTGRSFREGGFGDPPCVSPFVASRKRCGDCLPDIII